MLSFQLCGDRRNPGLSFSDIAFCLPANPMSDRSQSVIDSSGNARKMLPQECEALQGFPRGHTGVAYRSKAITDGLRHKSVGNSMAVNCMSLLGERISSVRGDP